MVATCSLVMRRNSERMKKEEATMSLQIPDMHTIWSWIFHVPDTYEMLWWVLLCVCWFGFVIERRLKSIQQQLASIPQIIDGQSVAAKLLK
jgi:hypothetical protein